MADRFLDSLVNEDLMQEELRKNIFSKQIQDQQERDLANAYAQSLQQNPDLDIPDISAGGNPVNYRNVIKQRLNQIANSDSVLSEDDALNIINSDPFLSKIFEGREETKLNVASAVSKRNQEKGAFHQTYSEYLDEDPTANLPEVNSNDESSFLGSIGGSLADTAWDIFKMPFNALDLTEESRNSTRRAQLAKDMSALGKNTVTGMNKLYSLRTLQDQRDRLQEVISRGISSNSERDKTNLQILDAKIASLSESLTDEEKRAIQENSGKYEELKRERDYLSAFNPDNFREVTVQDYLDAQEQAQLKRDQLLTTGNADFFNLDNIGYDLKYLKNMANTSHEFGSLIGQMIPWAAYGAELGTVKSLNILGSGVGKALMGIGTKGASRRAFTQAFADISRGLTSKSGLLKAGVTGLTYAGAYRKSVSDNLNEYFDREGTLDGFSEMQAGLYGMAEEFANFYGGKIAGELIPAGYLKKMFRSDVDEAMSALSKTMQVNPGAASEAALTQLLRKWTPNSLLGRFADRLDKSANRIQTEVNLGAPTKHAGAKIKGLKTASNALRGGAVILENKTGLSVGAMAKAGVSLATDNTIANVFHQKAQQKKEGIDWKEVGENAAEGLVAGAVGHIGSMGAGYAKHGVNKALEKKSPYFESQNVFNDSVEKARENMGTESIHNQITNDINQLENTKKAIEKDHQQAIKKTIEKYSDEKLSWNDGSLTDEKGNAVEGKQYSKLIKKLNDIDSEYAKYTSEAESRQKTLKQLRTDNLNEYFNKEENQDIEFSQSAFAGKVLQDLDEATDVETIKKRLKTFDKFKDYSEEEIQREAEAIFNGGSNTTGVSNEALDVAKAMGSTGRDLVGLSADAQKALADAKFEGKGSFAEEIDKEIKALDTNTSMSDEDKAKRKNRLESLKKKYTKEKYDKFADKAIISDKTNSNLIEKIDKNILPTEQDVDNATAQDIADLRNTFDNNTSKSDYINNKTAEYQKANPSATQQEVTDEQTRLGTMYDTYHQVLKDNIKAHNTLSSAGVRSYDSEAKVKNELKEAGLENDYSVEKQTYKKGGKTITRYYAKKKQSTSSEQLSTIQNIATNLRTNKVSIDKQVSAQNDKQQEVVNTLKNTLAEYAKELKDNGYINKNRQPMSYDDFLKATKETQLDILNLIEKSLWKKGIRDNLVTRKKAEKLDKAKKGESVISRYMTGHSVDQKAAENFQKRQENILQKKHAKERKFLDKQAEELGLKEYKKLSDEGKLKALVASLDAIGIFNSWTAGMQPLMTQILADPHMANNFSNIDTMPVTDLTTIINRWAGNVRLNTRGLNQLEHIISDLSSRQSRFDLEQREDLVGLLFVLRQVYHVLSNRGACDEGYAFIETKNRENFSETAGKELLTNLKVNVNNLRRAFNRIGVNPTAIESTELDDWDSDDLIKTNKNILNQDVQDYLQDLSETDINAFYANIHNLGSDPEFNAVWELLSIVPNATNNESTKRVGEQLADMAEDADVATFLRTNNSLNVYANAYSAKDIALQNKIVRFLLNQRSVLGVLGLLDQSANITEPLNASNYNQTIGSRWVRSGDISRITRRAVDLSIIVSRRNTIGASLFVNMVQKQEGADVTATQQYIISNLISNALEHPELPTVASARRLQRHIEDNYLSNINNADQAILQAHQADVLNALNPALSVLDDLESTTTNIELPSYNEILNRLNLNRTLTNEVRENIARAIASNLGQIIFNCTLARVNYLIRSGVLTTPVRYNNVYRHLSNASAHRNVTHSAYTDFREFRENDISEANLDTYIDILDNDRRNVESDIEEAIRNKFSGDVTDKLALIDRYRRTLFKPNSHVINPAVNIEKADRALMAEILAKYINYYGINNRLRETRANRSDVDTMISDNNHSNYNGDNLFRQSIDNAGNDILNPDRDLRRGYGTNNAFIHENGMQQYVSANSGSDKIGDIRELAKEIDDIASKLYRNLKVSKNPDRTIDALFSSDGENFNKFYTRNVAAAALSALPGIMTSLTEDYADVLLQRFGDARIVNLFREEHLADMDKVQLQLGETIVRSLGIRRNGGAGLYKKLAIEAGQHALIALALQGYIELGRINPSTCEYSNTLKGKQLAGTIRVLKVTPKGLTGQRVIRERTNYRNTDGAVDSILDNLLGLTDTREVEPADATAFNDQQRRYENQFNLTGPIRPNNPNPGHVVWSNDRELVAVCVGRDNNNNPVWHYARGKSIVKSDDVELTDDRLYELALKSRAPKHLNVEMVASAFSPLFNNDGTLRYTEEDAEGIDNIVRDNSGIRALINYGTWQRASISSSDVEGNFRQIIHTKDVEAFKKLLRNAQWFANHYFQPNSTNIRTDAPTRLFYNEINTVNNRAFVDADVFNYREDNMLRPFFNMNDDESTTLFVNQEVNGRDLTELDLALPILANFGLSYDKMDESQAEHTWKNLTSCPHFNELLTAAANYNDGTININEMWDAIRIFNGRVRTTNATRSNDQKYTSREYKPNVVTEEKTADLEIEQSLESITALQKILQINLVARNGSTAGSVADHLRANPTGFNLANLLRTRGIRNYNLTIEIDGLTNGPAIKNVASYLLNSDSNASIICLGAVGITGININTRFIKITDAYQQGILDTYMLNGLQAQYDIGAETITEMFKNGFQANEELEYLRTVYSRGETTDVEDVLEVMADILNRNVMKKPTMVTGYEAGLLSVSQKMIGQFDIETSKLLASGNNSGIRAWLDQAIKLNNGQPLNVTLVGYEGTYTLNSKGELSGGIVGSIFTNSILRDKVTFSILSNTAMKDKLQHNILDTFYNSLSKVMRKNQEPYEMNAMATEAIAAAYNEVLFHDIKNYLATHDNISGTRKYAAIREITDRVLTKVNAIFQVGDAELDTFKDSLVNDISYCISTMCETKNGNIFLKAKYATGAKESMGAGETPMVIHSFDSDIMHHFQHWYRQETGREFLAVHDAIIVTPDGIHVGDQMNKEFANSGINQLLTFVSRDRRIYQAIENITNMGNDTLPAGVRERLIYKLQSVHSKTSISTLSLIQDRLDWINKQRNLPEDQRMAFNQYSLMGGTAFIPRGEDFDRWDRALKDGLEQLKCNDLNMSQAIRFLEDRIRNSNNHNVIDTLLNSNGTLKEEVKKGAYNVNSLYDICASRVSTANDFMVLPNIVSLNDILSHIQSEPTVTDRILDAISQNSANSRGVNTIDQMLLSNTSQNGSDIIADVLNMVRLSTKRVGNTRLTVDESYVDQAVLRALSANRDLLARNDLTYKDLLNIIQDAVGNELSREQKIAFSDILQRVDSRFISFPQFSEFDNSRDTYVDYSDDIDYNQANDYLKSLQGKARLTENGNVDETLESVTSTWFEENILNPLIDQYKGKDNIQVVFTMRSKLDILRMKGLQYLKNTYPEFKNINIVVLPAITNINANTARADKEVSFYNAIRDASNNKIHTIYNASACPCSNRNNALLSVLTDTDITKESLVNKNQLTSESTIHLPNGNEALDRNRSNTSNNGAVTRLRKEIRPSSSYVYIYDEYGYNHSNATYRAEDNGDITGTLSSSLLNNTGIRNMMQNAYEYSDIVKATAEENQQAIINGEENSNVSYEDYSGERGNINNWYNEGQLTEAFTNPTVALGLNITSNGDLVSKMTDAMARQIPDLGNAMLQLKNQLDADYTKYLKGAITWEEYTRVRTVSIDNGMGGKKVFVFTVTQDTSATRQELTEAVELDTPHGKTFARSVVTGLPFTDMLNNKYRTHPELLYAFTSKYASDSYEVSSKRVRIPMHMLNTNRLEIGTTPQDLMYRNARFLGRAISNIQDTYPGVDQIIYLHSNRDLVGDGEQVLPNTGTMNYNWLDLSKLKHDSLDELNTKIKQSKSNFILNQVNRILDSSMVKGFARFGKVLSKVRGYTGTESERGMRVLNGEITRDIVSEALSSSRDYNRVLDDIASVDAQNGIDNSHLVPIVARLKTLSSKVNLYIDHGSRTVRDSMQASEIKEGRRKEYVYLGWGTNRESRLNGLVHELTHVVTTHLDVDATAKKQALALFDFVQRNFKITDFEDGDTLENRHIMEAIFSARTNDNLAEFIAYALTDKKFIKAMRNMKVNSELKNALQSKASGLFNRIVNKIANMDAGTSVAQAQTMYDAVLDIFDTCLASSKQAREESMDFNLVKTKEDNLFRFLANKEGKTATAIRDFLVNLTNNFKLTQPVAEVLEGQRLATSVESDSLEPARFLIDRLRKIKKIDEGFVNDLLANLEGVSQDQNQYLSLRMEGKSAIDACREMSISAVNDSVKRIIKDIPTELENKLTDFFVKADISCLFNSTMSAEDIHNLLTDKKARMNKIKDIEKSIVGQQYGNFFINASKGLAQYLTTGFNPTGLAYRNAYEIASLAGSNLQTTVHPTGPLVTNIDHLATLYAVDTLAAKDPDFYSKLKPETIKQLSDLHNGIKQAEYDEVYGKSAQKYHIPKGQITGGKIRGRYDVIPESEFKAYNWTGYVKIADAKLDPFYNSIAKEKYIIVGAKDKAPVPTTAGITVMTDIFKGRNKSGLSYNHQGKVDKDIDFKRTDEFKKLKSYVNQRVNALNKPNPQLLQQETHGNLVLNFNYLGDLTGANFELNPLETNLRIGRNVKMSSVLGDLYGSVIERSKTPEYNKKVGEAVIEIYEKAKDKENFVWISDHSEKEHFRELYDSLPYEVKEACADKYKEQGIPVRLKSLNTFFGYKNLSANDTEAYKKDLAKREENAKTLTNGFTDLVKDMFYNKYSGKAEQFFTWLAKTGKENLLIKGFSVSWNNIISNCATLFMNGLSPTEVVQFQAEALAHLKTVHDINEQLKVLHAKKLSRQYTNQDALQEQTLLKNLKSSPVYPLIEKGVINNTIAEDLSESDRFLKDTIDKLLPKGILADIGHNALLTPKAKLYGMLQDFASLGDSVGKYAIYKHLRSKGTTEKEAMRQAVNMYVDYSNPTPKAIQYLDDIGVLPFIKYALGTQSNILNTFVKHPDRSLGFLLADSMLGNPVPTIFQALLGLDTITDRLQLPGNMFLDSVGQLPSIRITNTLGLTSI